MSVLVCRFQGRFGNQALQFLFAYGFARRHQMEFQCDEWVGERVFQLPTYERPLPKHAALQRFSEADMADIALEMIFEPFDFEFRGYAQMQFCADQYTKRDAQSWLTFRPEIEKACQLAPTAGPIIAHRRVGDYLGYGYPVVSQQSYFAACAEYGLDSERMWILSEERDEPHPELPDDLSFVADFYRMVMAKTLLRGNSTFSWLAALLGNGLVLSPVIEGLAGGQEHRCRFVPGNWPRFTNLNFVTDLHVAP